MSWVTDILVGICVLLILAHIIYKSSDRDSTDDPEGSRSGLTVYTDYATGVQYVRGGILGGITPRINAEGKPYLGDLNHGQKD